MDDLLTGRSSGEEVPYVNLNITAVLSWFVFPLKKFISNSSKVIHSSKDLTDSFVNLTIEEYTKNLGNYLAAQIYLGILL